MAAVLSPPETRERETTGGGSGFGLPWNVTLPFCGSMTPDTVLKIVVLPAPLAPRIVTMPLLGTVKLTPRIAMIGP